VLTTGSEEGPRQRDLDGLGSACPVRDGRPHSDLTAVGGVDYIICCDLLCALRRTEIRSVLYMLRHQSVSV
jgi:hypothetical protein